MGYDYVRKTKYFNGKKYEAYGTTEQEAMMKLADKIAAAKNGSEAIGGNMTVNAWFNEWFETYKKPKGLTEKSLGMYEEKYNKYIKPVIGTAKLKDVRDIHLQKIMNAQAGKSLSHAKKVRLVLQEMFRRARISRIIPYDPAEELELPKTTAGKRRSITEAEREAILDLCKTHRAGLWILTLLYTGMRPGETAALTWADIDFELDEIRIHAAKESGAKRIKTPKTEAGIRTLPHIPNALLPLFKVQREGKKPFDFVFTTATGKPLQDYHMRKMWLSFKRELDIRMGAKVYRNQIIESVLADDLVPYCLRHTFSTDCTRAGVPIETVKWLMGHEDITTTANIYQDADRTALRNGLMLLERAK